MLFLFLFAHPVWAGSFWKVENGVKGPQETHVFKLHEEVESDETTIVIKEVSKKVSKTTRKKVTSSQNVVIANQISKSMLSPARAKNSIAGCKVWFTLENEYGRKSFCDRDVSTNENLQTLMTLLADMIN